jgi:serine/threonine protein kinase
LNAITKVVIASQRTGDYGVKLIRHVGIRIIEALQIAHTVSKIAHTDIRPANIILVPATSDEYRNTQYALAQEITSDQGQILGMFDLNSTKVLLNDWGNTNLKPNDGNKTFSDDLVQATSNLVLCLFAPLDLNDFSVDTKNQPSQVQLHQSHPMFNVVDKKKLQRLAKQRKYDEIVQFIAGLRFGGEGAEMRENLARR